jgi:predicted PhzF superfamily epimerase YddE/YHI9
LRSFTLAEEVFGQGHQTLGAWWAIAENNLIDLRTGENVIYQEIGDEILPLEIYVEAGKPQRVLMTQSKPVFGENFGDKAKLAESVEALTNRFFCRITRTAIGFDGRVSFLVPVKNIEALKKVRVDAAKLIAG